ncbi:MAG: hypothetical protein S0880_13610 [Actinomycetota bacterium]|nr:hypothetical protein [Actinomycetota bacterium]
MRSFRHPSNGDKVSRSADELLQLAALLGPTRLAQLGDLARKRRVAVTVLLRDLVDELLVQERPDIGARGDELGGLAARES